jgi:hypothetical protein
VKPYSLTDLRTAARAALRRPPRDRCDREPHMPTDNCAQFHCYAHDLDEPINTDSPHGFCCGECFHYYPTLLHLWIDYQWGSLPIYRAELKQRREERATRRNPQPITTPAPPPPTDPFTDLLHSINMNLPPVPAVQPVTYGRILGMIVRHLLMRPRRITFCPHCIHDL